ncbi:uncharacterized protein [Malus domestica]|uniref:uncharacterized protein n=1 Tax=Malus domestica TaxID=3750 RepID=UPI0039760ECF
MRREDEESDEEVQVRRKQNREAVMAAAMVCQPNKEQPQWDGSVAGHSYKLRNRAMMHVNLMNNYFNLNSVYTEEDFRRRFQMRHHVVEHLPHDVQQVYKNKYLCERNQEDLNRLLRKAENRGFPGMIGSLDCMHWDWKNCPTGWQGGFCGRSRKPTVVLEVVASYDTWI